MPEHTDAETAEIVHVDYVCPTHGTILTIDPDDRGPFVYAEVRCAHETNSDGRPSICGQVAVFVARGDAGRDTEAGDPNPHPTGNAAAATRDQA